MPEEPQEPQSLQAMGLNTQYALCDFAMKKAHGFHQIFEGVPFLFVSEKQTFVDGPFGVETRQWQSPLGQTRAASGQRYKLVLLRNSRTQGTGLDVKEEASSLSLPSRPKCHCFWHFLMFL